MNGSGSHHQLRKLDTRLQLMRGSSAKAGGVYVYANQRGCDGGRLYYDGCACVFHNGELVAQGQQFGLKVCLRLGVVLQVRTTWGEVVLSPQGAAGRVLDNSFVPAIYYHHASTRIICCAGCRGCVCSRGLAGC
jgi:hypothetical protein